MPKQSCIRLAKPINIHKVQKKQATLIQRAIVDYTVIDVCMCTYAICVLSCSQVDNKRLIPPSLFSTIHTYIFSFVLFSSRHQARTKA